MAELMKKRIMESLNMYSMKKEQEEANFKRLLQENPNEETIERGIKAIRFLTIQKKFYELLLEKTVWEATNYVDDYSNWKNLKEEIRTKFNVPKNI